VTLNPDVSDYQAVDTVTGKYDPRASGLFWGGKRCFDLFFASMVLLPAMLMVAAVLLMVNPFFNPGPLFFHQKRMGRYCRAFHAVKFRSMSVQKTCLRGPNDPMECDRITPIGRFLRRSRFDELPQILNVYRGEMSLIGPRPDYFHHASHFLQSIPEYRLRHTVRPGISGLAQIELGYAEGIDATRLKTAADIDYIRRAGFRLDTWIFWRTITAVVRLRGS
jgi:lipopolysaccharide/colanic/teichoic acid biosynthesis glycosyltransferase